MCRLKLLFFPNNIGNKINDLVYKRFKNQLKRDKDGWYETGLLWKQEQKSQIENNEDGRKARLNNSNYRKMKNCSISMMKLFKTRSRKLQLKQHRRTHKVLSFFTIHPVIHYNTKKTKYQIVHDKSDKVGNSSISLNDCLERVLLQNNIWNILPRKWFKPIALFADMKVTFLQILICENEKDYLQVHWILNKHPLLIKISWVI